MHHKILHCSFVNCTFRRKQLVLKSRKELNSELLFVVSLLRTIIYWCTENKNPFSETKQVDTLIVIVAEMLSESAAILFAVDWKIDWSIKQAFFIYCEVATMLV